MKKFAVIVAAILLSGCAHVVPTTAKFPEASPSLMVECPELDLIPEASGLTDTSKVINKNYGKYHQCKNDKSGWIEWYKTQKKIFEDATKK